LLDDGQSRLKYVARLLTLLLLTCKSQIFVSEMKLNRIALKMEVDVKVQKTDATGC
jgi:hypothetical protein